MLCINLETVVFVIFAFDNILRELNGTFTIAYFASVTWIGCLTSQSTIFQSYMWRHIDVQADWRRSWTYGRAPNAVDIS